VQIPAVHSFWDFNIGNLLTVAGVLLAWVTARYLDSKSRTEEYAILRKRVELLEKWQEKHEDQADQREQAVQKLEVAMAKVATIAETIERRRSPRD
jgi:uncharacterized protein YlxW (UPF0749 family)